MHALADFLAWCEKRTNLIGVSWGKSSWTDTSTRLPLRTETLNQLVLRSWRGFTLGASRRNWLRTRDSVSIPGKLRASTGLLLRIGDAARDASHRDAPGGEDREGHRAERASGVEVAGRNALLEDQLLVETLAYTGLRCSELLDLRLEPFGSAKLSETQAALMVKVVGKGRKLRQVPFPAALVRNLHRYIALERKYAPYAGESDRLFLSAKGKPLRPSGAEYVFRCASARAGAPVHPHLLRHFFACHRLKYLTGLGLGDPLGQLQRELGHSQIMTTTR